MTFFTSPLCIKRRRLATAVPTPTFTTPAATATHVQKSISPPTPRLRIALSRRDTYDAYHMTPERAMRLLHGREETTRAAISAQRPRQDDDGYDSETEFAEEQWFNTNGRRLFASP